MLLQDGTDAGAHWPTHKIYSVSLHTEKSRYLNYFKGEEKGRKTLKYHLQKCETGCSGWIGLSKAWSMLVALWCREKKNRTQVPKKHV